MTPKEIRELSPQELEKKLRDTRRELLDLRMRKQTGQLEKTHEIPALRRDIARMATILRTKTAATQA
ncbi:MAG: 50S ribosomal protein L29 [Puniceicoccaceae bacterium]|nr:MAG: 50S ribosomal protein L29 [Puniceicoccaceae bacterium]